MDLNFSTLSALLRETLRDPRAAARRLIDLDLPDAARWQALALVVVLSMLLLQLALLLSPSADVVNAMGGAALQAGVLQGIVLLVTVAAVHLIGRGFGGTGEFRDALILMAWLQFVTLCFQIAQIVAMLILPPLSALVAIASVIAFIWLLVSFIQELHGFRSRGLVFVGLLVSFFALALALSLVLALLGFTAPEALE